MKREQFINLGFTEDMARKVMDILREERKGFIPKSRFDQVNDIKKELEKRLAIQEAQIAELNNIRFHNQEFEKIVKELWNINAAVKAEQEAKLRDILIRSAIRSKLVHVKYAELLISRFDKSRLTIASDGTVSGIDEQLEEMKASYEWLFLT